MTEPEFTAYGVGMVCASVCSTLPINEITRRLNVKHPTGIDSDCELSGELFSDGSPNPHPCDREPDTHKHYLFHC